MTRASAGHSLKSDAAHGDTQRSGRQRTMTCICVGMFIPISARSDKGNSNPGILNNKDPLAMLPSACVHVRVSAKIYIALGQGRST